MNRVSVNTVVEWAEANGRMMEGEYPQFTAIEPPPGVLRAWEGSVAPFSHSRSWAPVIEDLQVGRQVLIQGGTLLHDPRCSSNHEKCELAREIIAFRRPVTLRILLLAPDLPPKAFSLDPFVGPHSLYSGAPQPPHTYADGSLCPYFPSTDSLPEDETRLVRFLDYTSIWVAKFLVWTGTLLVGAPRWIGPDVDHAPWALLANTSQYAPCPCGLPRRYSECCCPGHESLEAAIREIVSQARAASRS